MNKKTLQLIKKKRLSNIEYFFDNINDIKLIKQVLDNGIIYSIGYFFNNGNKQYGNVFYLDSGLLIIDYKLKNYYNDNKLLFIKCFKRYVENIEIKSIIAT